MCAGGVGEENRRCSLSTQWLEAVGMSKLV